MTYSHNSVRNNIRMTTASATKSIRLKKGAAGAATSASNSSTPSPTSPTSVPASAAPLPVSASASAPATPLVTAHSNSIASSTNLIQNNSPNFLSTSPTSLGLSNLATPPNQRQRPMQSQSQSTGAQRRQQQRHSPQQQGSATGGGGGYFFANNNRRTGGGRSPQGAMQVRQSPATILGGGFSPAGGSARKQRKSPPLGGKISPQQMQLQQQHPLIPTALTHFAGSKCFDAPAPTALPKPPQHWTRSEEKLSSVSMSMSLPKFQMMQTGGRSKRNLLDDFDTHNLKLLLNVQS
ncbi:hypothetical protein KR038_010542 [Drosophila bunnanda]|nr:hypothetical protein KR038_010542 [Drosophila bunnanda]